jgi:hypothetical protein
MVEGLQVQHLSRSKLEGLSSDELIRLADSFGIDIPPGLERIFIIEELLEYSNTDEQQVKDDLEVVPAFPETAALPKQYNISFIEVIIRDPLWAFVLWEIKAHDRETHEAADDFKGYCLSVIQLDEGETFRVPVSADDSARYLGFAEHSSKAQGRYKINLCVLRGDQEVQIASSAPFCLPRLIDNEEIYKMKEIPLLRLSGVHDLSITKSTDRQPRVKRS